MKDGRRLQAVTLQSENGLAALGAPFGLLVVPGLPKHTATIRHSPAEHAGSSLNWMLRGVGLGAPLFPAAAALGASFGVLARTGTSRRSGRRCHVGHDVRRLRPGSGGLGARRGWRRRRGGCRGAAFERPLRADRDHRRARLPRWPAAAPRRVAARGRRVVGARRRRHCALRSAGDARRRVHAVRRVGGRHRCRCAGRPGDRRPVQVRARRGVCGALHGSARCTAPWPYVDHGCRSRCRDRGGTDPGDAAGRADHRRDGRGRCSVGGGRERRLGRRAGGGRRHGRAEGRRAGRRRRPPPAAEGHRPAGARRTRDPCCARRHGDLRGRPLARLRRTHRGTGRRRRRRRLTAAALGGRRRGSRRDRDSPD